MPRNLVAGLLMVVILAALPLPALSGADEVSAWILPYVSHLRLKPEDVKTLVEKRAVARSLRGADSREMGGIVVALFDASPASIVTYFRSHDFLRDSRDTLTFGSFSAEPSIADLRQLTIDAADLNGLLNSREGDSDIKLSSTEIQRIKIAAGEARTLTPRLKERLTEEYKRILLDRVRAHNFSGGVSLEGFADKGKPVDGRLAFASLVAEQTKGGGHCEHIENLLLAPGKADAGRSESFTYWAKQRFADLKPIINIVQVQIHTEGSRVFILSKQIYSSHYTDAGLSVAELIEVENQPDHDTRTLMAYSLRVQVDLFNGTLGFLTKRMAQSRFLAKLKESVMGLAPNLAARCPQPGC